ncbi:RHS repeat-associated core domain-containing protein [Actinacidiphila oryziradicis]|uniref:Teneurin-like YD-shell domain-containing protein n=1 Tax=Actinacidiphila oryziradicis TaxID=2571141 RepID=A0A4U0SRD0_9ACTN|nr:RHS repeat-associated core domain-containing protein [Actinacidiphila oryziradicis]TKA02945.1 hypothetical protein FCI23_38085 [Actinacidiphila oryziradicis]
MVTNNAYNVAGNPGSALISVSLVSIPDTTVSDHDGLGRADLVTEEHDGTKTWATTTAYTGDKTTVLPPKGGVAAATVVNARGQSTELDQYTAAPTLTGTAAAGFTATSGTTSPTTYSYTPAGQQAQVTGPDQTVWKTEYDLLGRKTTQTDPDAGTSKYGYDDAGNLVSTTDARNIELDYTYDLLGRRLTGTDKSKSGFEFASWLYDTLQIGKPTSSTRYVQGTTGGYTTATTGYNTLGKPNGTKITLPAAEAPLPATWTTTYGYSINDQLLQTQSDPRTTGLASETILYEHDRLGNPTKTTGGGMGVVAGTVYTNYGAPSLITVGDSTNPVTATYHYDDQTLRPTERVIARTQAPGPTVDDTKYSYDASGNPTSTTDQQSETGNTVTDQQCYSYDTLDRLSAAWTANDNCAANPPTSSTLTTTAGSYWQSFSYDAIGDREQSIDHAIGSSGTTVTTGYTNGCTTNCNATGAQPHTLTATTGGTNPTTFVYDTAGNLLTRTPTTGAGQSLTWDDEGHLAEADTTGTSPTATKYLYDADGNQLIRRDPGRTTLFAGDTEIIVNTSVTPNVLLGGVRTYSHGGAGAPVAVYSSLTGGGRKYLFNDPHGTATLAMDTTTQQVARQQYTPYGQPRTSPNTTTWPDPTHSYLGKPQDTATGYTDVGARKYDPTLGRFISADPLLETTSPQQLGGYTYAADNPITSSDPTGLHSECGQNGDSACASSSPPASDCPPFCSADGQPHGPSGTPGANRNSDGSEGGGDLGGDDGNGTHHQDHHIGRSILLGKIVGIVNTLGRVSDIANPACWVDSGSCSYDPNTTNNWAASLGADPNSDDYKLSSENGSEATWIAIGGARDLVADGEMPGGYKCSFAPQTPVLMANGKSKAIGKIKVGDEIESADAATGIEKGGRVVQHVWINRDINLLDLTVRGADGKPATLHTTSNHPFWDNTTHS